MTNIITGSPNISVLGARIIADLCVGKFYVDTTPSVYIGSGGANVLGARIRITNPYGVVIKDYAAPYEIAPSLVPDAMNTVVQFTVPLQSGDYQYGKYVFDIKLTDADNKEYTLSIPFDVKCIPFTKLKKQGVVSANFSGSCKNGKVTVLVNQPPVYNGVIFSSQVAAYVLEYPTGSALPNLNITTGNFSAPLFEGVYRITGTTCVTYNLGDNLFIKIKYKLSYSKEVRCGINECAVLPRLQALNEQLDGECSAEEKFRITNIILESLNLIKLVELGIECGEDISAYASQLSNLLNINDQEITTIVNNGTPSKDIVIAGCNVVKTTVGLTDTYTIDNYEYVVAVQDNGGALVVSAATINGCIKTQTITFNITAAYNQIKNIISASSLEKTFLTNIVGDGLKVGGVNWTLLGLTPNQVTNMTFSQLINYLLNYVKACCECLSTITANDAVSIGNDVRISWTGTDLFSIEAYIDSVLVATVLSPATSYTFLGLSDSRTHTYTLIPKNANGKSCTPRAGNFTFFGCAAINPPTVGTSNANGVACPYDLTALVTALPSGQTAEWHSQNNTLPSTLVGNPAAVSSGVYFVFAKSSNGCYSTGVQVTVLCAAPISCTAPQNLMVVPATGGFLVQFQSAINNPPVYNVRRRLKADPDVVGSYTTIGTPVWNASNNRWEILDTTAVNNTLYVYRAESLCANSTKPFIDYTFANLICPALTTTPHEISIDYSFAHAGGAVDKYQVAIFNSTGLIKLQENEYVPAFSIPVVGTFAGLSQNTSYQIRVRMLIGTYYNDCGFVIVATQPVNVCPDVTGIGGAGFGGTP